MIVFPRQCGSKTVYVRFSENKDEDKQLEILVREVEVVCRISKNTGLHIVHSTCCAGRRLIITSLRQKEEISAKDLAGIKEEVERKVQEKI
ncbi:TPA: hypothetical protein DCQ44_01650 [Candidatus Taylorbacteria bacterium]|nr:hypothetical protein [Candidatus Taylorbacteria bacterium]